MRCPKRGIACAPFPTHDQAMILPITIEARRCANGETHEFWLAVNGRRVGGEVGVFRSVLPGERIEDHAGSALSLLLARAESRAKTTDRRPAPC